MKHILLTTIAAVLLVGCGESQQNPIHDTDGVKLVEPVVDDAILEPPATTVTPAQPQPSPPVAEKPVQQPFPTAEANRSKPVVEPAPPAKIVKNLTRKQIVRCVMPLQKGILNRSNGSWPLVWM